ncbi:metal-dependent hydrolase (beta-lactamase superfamily II) [Paraburkholderia youngii]
MGDGFEYFSRAGRSVMRLESAGIDLAATTDIVITHMHMDHVGGPNVAGVKAKLRPDVRIHVSAAEVEFSKNPDFSKTVMPESVPPALRKAARHHLGIAPIIVISTIPHPNRMKAKVLRALVGPAKKINCWKPQKTRNL